MLFFAMVAYFPWIHVNHIFFFWIPNVFLVTEAQVLTFFFGSVSPFVFVLNVSWGDFCISDWTSSVFLLSVSECLGTARSHFNLLLIYSSSECVLCLLFDLFCDGPTSSCIIFLLQFSFSEISITSGLSSSKGKPYCNFWKWCSHVATAVFVFLWIYTNWEIDCLNKCQNCYSLGCHCVWPFHRIVQHFCNVPML